MNEPDWGQAYAGETRHILDWLYGINLSRALMSAIKTTGSFKLLSIGRVQGPALKIIVDREREIENFKPEPYWQIFARVEKHEFKHPTDIFDKSLLKTFEK
jgi:DNA topoisomerase-1